MEHQKKACRLKRHTIVVFTKHLPRSYKHKGAFFVIIRRTRQTLWRAVQMLTQNCC